MPADHLATAEIETAIAHVITGAPVTDTARAIGMNPTELADAAEVYRQAGRQALNRAAPDWWQVYIHFTDWEHAEHTVADHLAPLLHQAEANAVITAWWFIRKHPCWRLRVLPGPAGHTMNTSLSAALDELAADGRIAAWWPGIYEAETAAFGGEEGIKIAHTLFCADSRAVLELFRDGEPILGRRELSLLLCTILFRAAGAEWFECGDVWHRVAQLRPLPNVPTSKLTAMAADARQLILADTTPDGPLLSALGPLAHLTRWASAFEQAGQALRAATRTGALRRGLRHVLSYHVIFHWNRLGLTTRTQSILAQAARTAILEAPPT